VEPARADEAAGGGRLRVLLATNSADRGSTSRTLEAWARLLPAAGIDPVVTVGARGPLLNAVRALGVPCEVRPLRVIPRKIWPFPFAAAVLRLAALIRRSGARLVHVNEHDSHFLAARAARLAGVPVVTHVRFLPDAEYCRWLFRSGYWPARLFFTSETQLRDSALRLAGTVPRERWRVLSNGLDPTAFGLDGGARERLRREWRLDDAAVALGIACPINPRKQVDHFVRLLARLARAGEPVRGFVAGRPHFAAHEALLADLRRLARDEGIADRLSFLGEVEPVEPLYHAWDLSVSTSNYETFGMSVLESMICGCPTVAYEGGSVGEVVADGARLVATDDESALFESCLALCRDAGLRRALAERGRARVLAAFDIRPLVARLADEYRAVAAGRGGRV
jgi:glycosyltransferase involved in cell wall biosynthesis